MSQQQTAALNESTTFGGIAAAMGQSLGITQSMNQAPALSASEASHYVRFKDKYDKGKYPKLNKSSQRSGFDWLNYCFNVCREESSVPYPSNK